MKMNVWVVGSGKLANEMLSELKGEKIESVRPWKDSKACRTRNAVAVHAGSGRELRALHAFCSTHQIPLFELSTGMDYHQVQPDFPVIICANTNILMLRFMAMMRRAGNGFTGYDKTLLESHQASKTSAPGTALSLSRSLGIEPDQIQSVRDPERQRTELGIPDRHIERHAFHRIHIRDDQVSLTFESKVLGKAPYATGLSRILHLVPLKELKPGLHDVIDFF